MYAVAFDLVVKDAAAHHPSGMPPRRTPTSGGSSSTSTLSTGQGSLYTTDDEDMAKLFAAIHDLKTTAWFPKCVKDIRAFRVEQWSDFTAFVKS